MLRPQAFCGKLERLTEHNKGHSELVNKAGRELIILGFIAFGVILLKELNVFHWNTDTLLCFEFCDLLISICVLICALLAIKWNYCPYASRTLLSCCNV